MTFNELLKFLYEFNNVVIEKLQMANKDLSLITDNSEINTLAEIIDNQLNIFKHGYENILDFKSAMTTLNIIPKGD